MINDKVKSLIADGCGFVALLIIQNVYKISNKKAASIVEMCTDFPDVNADTLALDENYFNETLNRYLNDNA